MMFEQRVSLLLLTKIEVIVIGGRRCQKIEEKQQQR